MNKLISAVVALSISLLGCSENPHCYLPDLVLEQGVNVFIYHGEDDELLHALHDISGRFSYVYTFVPEYGIQSWSEDRPSQNNDLLCLVHGREYYITMKEDGHLQWSSSVGCPVQ